MVIKQSPKSGIRSNGIVNLF